MRWIGRALLVGLVLLAASFAVWRLSSSRGAPVAAATGRGPGAAIASGRCTPCHPAEARAWARSHHARAMQRATPSTVQGHFADAEIHLDGLDAKLSRKGDTFLITTIGSDGQWGEFEARYTFGVEPLQQYLVGLPGGKLQVFGAAWDARPTTAGGQRWFNINPELRLRPGQALHWTGRDQQWNGMCAACHSTRVQKRYDADHDTFDTVWAEISVGCQACHPQGEAHVGAAANLAVPATAPPPFTTATPTELASSSADEINRCFPCHSRRQQLDEHPETAPALLDAYAPMLLDRGLYHPDGQIDDENFEFGSFIQSRMHAVGVRCSHCHDPHSAKLWATGNALCSRCHQPTRYDRPEHHHHLTTSAGAQCVSCHMPTKVYMGVHVRRDHAIRIPRPDLSEAIGVPNPCDRCHADRGAAWATGTLRGWGVVFRSIDLRFARAIAAARQDGDDANDELAALSQPGAIAPIRRATALSAMRGRLSPSAKEQLRLGLGDDDDLVRFGAARALDTLDEDLRIAFGVPALKDRVRAVRIEAARALADAPRGRLPMDAGRALKTGLAELIATRRVSADRPESALDLAQVFTRLGRTQEAESELRRALRLDPENVAARVNLADLLRTLNRDDEGEDLLHQALTIAPARAETWHALGLLEVRRGRRRSALEPLGRAHSLEPGQPDYGLAYALALIEGGRRDEALQVVRRSLEASPSNPALLALQRQLEGGAPDARVPAGAGR